jgi:pilus assembly protein CpaB
MNFKNAIPLAVAIVLGGVAAKVGHDLVAHQKAAAAISNASVARMIVAKDGIAPGTILTAELLGFVTVPVATVPPGSFADGVVLSKRVTIVSLMKGQPIMENMLAPEGSSNGLTAIVPDGYRAVTLDVNEVSGVAGLLVPGCRIDVVTTIPAESGQMVARTIARNLEIVAVGRRFGDAVKVGAKEDAGDLAPAKSVTVIVTPKEAELIDLAAHTGAPRLVLRGSRDTKTDLSDDFTQGVTLADLRGMQSEHMGFSGLITKLIEVVARAQTPAPSSLFETPAATTKPVESTTRLITVIRNTKEEAVQIERRIEGFQGPTPVANTDQSDVNKNGN